MKKRLTDDEVRERLSILDRYKKAAVGISVWDMIVSLSAGVHGEIKDWPAQIREPIEREIERQCKPQVGWSVAVVASGCFQDVAWEPCYIRVIVQEFPPIVRH